VMQVVCKSFKRFERNTLRGFCEVELADIHLSIKDVAVHEKNSSRWAQLPSKPMLNKDGATVKDSNGKVQYAHIMDFATREQRDAFSAAVIRPVLAVDPDAFGPEPPF
jgi:gluconate kinase